MRGDGAGDDVWDFLVLLGSKRGGLQFHVLCGGEMSGARFSQGCRVMALEPNISC